MFQVTEDAILRGATTLLNAILNDGCIADKHIAASAGVAASKLEHQHRAAYAQESDTTAAAEDRVVHVVVGSTGTLQAFNAGCVVACVGNATVTVDLHKNGASVLTAAIVIDSGDAAYAQVDGVIDTTAVAAGDVLEVVITVAAGTGTLGKGAFAMLDLYEDA